MKKKNSFVITVFGFALLTAATYVVLSSNSKTENVAKQAVNSAREIGQDAVKEAKSGIRKVQDETCEMFDGKLECAAQKVKHQALDAKNEVEDKLN